MGLGHYYRACPIRLGPEAAAAAEKECLAKGGGKAIRHLKITKICLPRMRYFCPEALGYTKETAEGMELARLKAEPRIRLVHLSGGLRSLPQG